jgi:acyl-CoA reductase-like NAD-dependent aldehyde dehydrogenase
MTFLPETGNPAPTYLTGRSPLTGAELPPVAEATREDVTRAVQGARGAQLGWSAHSLGHRTKALRRAAKAMLDDRTTILDILRDEAGKLEVDALFSEALGPLDQVNSWAKVAKAALAPRQVGLNPLAFPKKSASYRMVPRGVVGCITPWNYPIATFFRPVLPALLAGNGVVVKPSEHTPRAAAWFLGHLQRELPKGLLGVVQGRGAVGEALIDSGIDACTFTGSVRTGKRVIQRCGEHLIPCNVELGGKDAAILLEDCDLDRAVQGITHWALHNVGQACAAIEVALVPNAIADAFVDRLSAAWKKLSCAPGEYAKSRRSVCRPSWIPWCGMWTKPWRAAQSYAVAANRRGTAWVTNRRSSTTARQTWTWCVRRRSARFWPSCVSIKWTKPYSGSTRARTDSPRRSGRATPHAARASGSVSRWGSSR